MIAKSVRRWVAQCAVVALAFGQIATTAYACPVQGAAAPLAVAHGVGHAGNGPCGGMDTAPVNTQANACEVHCTDGIAVPAQPDLPPVVLAALPVVAMPYTESDPGAAAPDAAVVALSGAPPVALRFCRLLI